jgi:hypothetical protein
MHLKRNAANGRSRAHLPETGLRSRRHHQHHGPGAPDQLERHETPVPRRPDAVKALIQCVRQRIDLHDQLNLSGNTVLVVLM